MLDPRYSYSTYWVRRKPFKLFGGKFYIFDQVGQLVMYAKIKAFKSKEDIRLYADENMETELLIMRPRQIIDFPVAYDVTDATTGEKVGVLKKRMIIRGRRMLDMKSVIRDKWVLMDGRDTEIGVIQEDNVVLALARRFICNLIPRKLYCIIQGQKVALFKQGFNPFVLKMTLDFTPDTANLLDRRLGLASAILLLQFYWMR